MKIKKIVVLFLMVLTHVVYGASGDYQKYYTPKEDPGVLLNRSKEFFEQQRLRREMEEEKQKNRTGIEAPESGKLHETPEGEIKFKLKGFEFSPSEVLTTEELKKLTAPYLQREVSVNDLYKLINEINALYEEKGYIVCKAGLPPQTISNGIVKIVLIEGKTGRILIQGNKSTKDDYIRKRINLNTGTVSNLNELNKSLVWFNGTNDVQMRIELAAGEIPGTTDYVLTAYEPKRYIGTIFADNSGSETSGEYRLGANYVNSSLFGYRDQLVISAVGSEGTAAGSFMYSFPITKKGTRFGLNYSKSKVKIVDGPLEDVDVKGESSSYGINITHPFVVNEKRKIEGTFDFTKQKSSTDFMGFTWVDDEITRYTAGVAITTFGSGYVWYNKHNISKGTWEKLSGEKMDYMKYDTTFMLQKMCRETQMLTLRFNGQYSFDDYLPSADQFYVGGSYSVRGYTESFMGADHGFSLSIEYSFPALKKGELFVFLDGGMVEGENAFDENKIYSTGFGYRVSIADRASISAALGIPLAKNFDGDEMEVDSCRVHLVASYQF
ncbi:ShlB/FhaC/HecB family hemolysin secretion/activation protein [Fusobacterium varium]|uniref:ShlB/FhaC/HecB family hemolysin secretion/activation protein n=1 Tax=Fusobacterium varium TaxID=856 RepID=UPI00241E77DF|nr:ShlB/FhaC/HecB family hemolysin secretion/activation protein [Fusobacterium varium]